MAIIAAISVQVGVTSAVRSKPCDSADDGRAARMRDLLLADAAELVMPPLGCCFGTSPIQAEKSRPDRNAVGSATLATRAVASAGPTPGISLLVAILANCKATLSEQVQCCDRFSGSRFFGQSAARHLWMLVGSVVVEDHVHDFFDRHLRLNGVQEADELLVTMAPHTSANDLALRGHREQRTASLCHDAC